MKVGDYTLQNQFDEDLSALIDTEREFIEDYLESNAKYRPNEKVFKKDNSSDDWRACFIGWRDVNKETWAIEYYTHHIKKDGSPSKLMSGYPCTEECIKPYK